MHSTAGSAGSPAGLRLQTERLLLRPLTLHDLDDVAELLGDADALALWGHPLDRQQSRTWIERNLMRYARDGHGRCAVVERISGTFVGDAGLICTVVEDQPEVELGWIVHPTHRGRGFATEAGAAWRDFAFETLRRDRLVSMISDRNTASRKVAEKLGMAEERDAVWNGVPMLMYSIERRSQPPAA